VDLFEIVGDDFFKPLTSLYRSIYLQCLKIIFDSYRTELSYGVDRELLVQKLMYYFDDLNISDIHFEDTEDIITDSRNKASTFLRKLKDFGWIEYETGADQRVKVNMPNHVVTLLRSFESIESGKETEYQSEISAIYSLLTNPDLLQNPYPQIVKPVYDRTIELFTALKLLNSSIKKYIDDLTADKTADEIIANYFTYADNIGSKAYHRLNTSDNVSRFRNMILAKLGDIQRDPEIFERVAWGYQTIETEADLLTARDQARKMINDVIDYFHSYDSLAEEIRNKHNKYLNNTVRRARFLLMNTNNTEGKISTILQYMADQLNKDEESHLDEDAPEEICSLFNIFPQGFISEESIKSMPVSRKITDVEEIFSPLLITEEERKVLRLAAYEKNKNRFSRKNITVFVNELLKDRDCISASSIPIESRRDMIRVIFIRLYGQSSRSEYNVKPTGKRICRQGFIYNDFEIRRRR